MTLMNRYALALAAVSLVGSAAVGCADRPEMPSPGPQTTTIEVSYDDLLSQKEASREAGLAVGDFLQISLGSNASTGYQWVAEMQISDPQVLVQTGHERVGPAESRPGAAGREVWVLQAVGPGTATVSTSYGQPWAGGEKGTWTFTAVVTVK